MADESTMFLHQNNQMTSILLCVLLTLIIVMYVKSRQRKLPPGPRGLPIIGNLLTLPKGTRSEVFINFQKIYGDVFSVKLGQYLYVVINGYDTLREAFVKNGNLFSDRPDMYILKKKSYGYKGLSQSSGKLWKTTRTFALQALRGFGFGKKSMESKIMEEVHSFIQSVKNHKGQPFYIKDIIHSSVTNVICHIILSKRFSENDKTFIELMEAMESGLKLQGVGKIGIHLPVLRYLPGDLFKINRCDKDFEHLKKFLANMVDEHEVSFDGDNIRDYADAFIREKRRLEGQGIKEDAFSVENLIVSLMNLFIGGTETTATTIKWAVLFLIHYQHIQEKVYKEISRVCGVSRLPRLEDQKELVYCNAFISEVMRIRAILPLAGLHGASRDIEFKGYMIPKGSIIVPNLDSVMFDPLLFPEPHKFDPSRFIDDNGHLDGHKNVLSFSLGRRACMAETLARHELFLFISSMIQQFKFLPENENELPSLVGVDGRTYSPRTYRVKALERNR